MDRTTASPVALMRRYVNDYVNRHDFSVISQFMADDYTLRTGGATISGRDGFYRDAVAKQLSQFPGLIFTLHEIHHCGNSVAMRFTEHGASTRHAGRAAAWPSIAIYKVRGGMLAECTIEQDYFSRRHQLESGIPVIVDPPAIAPWDTVEQAPNTAAELVVRRWLEQASFTAAGRVQIDDARATGEVAKIIDDPTFEFLDIMSAGNHVAFHAMQRGLLAADFTDGSSTPSGTPVCMHLSGLIEVRDDTVHAGNIIRDRWGLYRRLDRT